MRQTFSDLITICQNGAGKDTSTASQTFFKQRINSRAEFILAKLPSHFSEITKTFSTVEDQQYYHYPPNIKEIEGIKITIGSVDYTLTSEVSLKKWNKMNALSIQAGAVPTTYFKRQRDFGIYPIPQDAYTATIDYSIRAGGMTATDYTTGTVTATENDATITGSGTTFTATMDERWFSLADATSGDSRGSWYRIGSFTSTTALELETVFEETTEAGASFIVGESPELPEEGHELCAHGALVDYFLGFRQSPNRAKVWSNMFWTGDPDIKRSQAELSSKPWAGGGLLGLINDYRDRDSSQLIKRGPSKEDPRMKVWATTLT